MIRLLNLFTLDLRRQKKAVTVAKLSHNCTRCFPHFLILVYSLSFV